MERIFEKPDEQFDNVADRTTAEMMGEHLEAAFNLLKQVRPEAKGFRAIVVDSPSGDETQVEVTLIEDNNTDHQTKPFPRLGYNKGMNTEYCAKFPGIIEKMNESKCPHTCVIPYLTVDNADGIKNVAACFVHVLQTNTTYYIDDKHRIGIVWAGPVEYNNYDYANNPLKLRSQQVWDFENNRVIYYNKTGGYKIGALGA